MIQTKMGIYLKAYKTRLTERVKKLSHVMNDNFLLLLRMSYVRFICRIKYRYTYHVLRRSKFVTVDWQCRGTTQQFRDTGAAFQSELAELLVPTV